MRPSTKTMDDANSGDRPADDEVLRTPFDPDARSVSDVVANALSESLDGSATDVARFATVVDPIVLDALFRRRRRRFRLTFDYEGRTVTVMSEGEVVVRPGGTTPEVPVSTEAAFRSALDGLLGEAWAGGVDVSGGWVCHTDDGECEWNVEVTAVGRPDDAGADAG